MLHRFHVREWEWEGMGKTSGIPWEWELVTKLGMGMGRNGNRLHGNGREWECKKPFPGISTVQRAVRQIYNNSKLIRVDTMSNIIMSTVKLRVGCSQA